MLMNSCPSLSPLLAVNAQGRLWHRQEATLGDWAVAVSTPPVAPCPKSAEGLLERRQPFQEAVPSFVGHLLGLRCQGLVVEVPDMRTVFRGGWYVGRDWSGSRSAELVLHALELGLQLLADSSSDRHETTSLSWDGASPYGARC